MFQKFSPSKLSILMAVLLVAVQFVFLSLLFPNLIITLSAFKLVFAFFLLLITNFILIYFFLIRFIYERINIIYKRMKMKQSHKPELSSISFLKNENLLEKVSNDVENWAAISKKEIEQLKKMAQYRKEFVGNVSHELKTPIFNIQGYILTLLDGAMEDEAMNKKYLEKTEKNINRMITIVNDLEAISRFEHGRLELRYQKFSITELTKEVFEAIEDNAKRQEIRLQIEGKNLSETYVYADKGYIRQVLTNLVNNAINYGNKGGNVFVEYLTSGNNCTIKVKDDGIGIDEEHLPRLFERFYRVDKSRSKERGGTGLGLSIVKHIIEAHNRNIEVQSKVGEGTTFSFTLQKA